MPTLKAEPIVVEPEINWTTPPAEIKNPNIMLSTEIAALTEKQHKDVMRDIRVILARFEFEENGAGFVFRFGVIR